MGYCLPVLVRILGPKRFIEQFLASFTWRGSFNCIGHRRCDEYMTAYQTYSVHHKYYHDDRKGAMHQKNNALQSSLSIYDTDNTLNSLYFADLCDIILSFSESYLGEICYFFHIWKDNLLIPIQWSSDKVGPAWNIKKIFQDILQQFPCYKKSLKQNNNFRISMNIIERSDRIYNTMNEDKFFKFLKSKSDQLSNEQMEQHGFDVKSLPIWKTAYPVIKIGGKRFELTDNNTFSNDEWMDDTSEIKRKLTVMNDDLFETNKRITLHGLQSKPQWNGTNGTIVDEYNFKKERWPIKIDKPVHKCVLIKTCNLALLR